MSFYRSGDGDVLDTSVAQVFNALGDGVIVRGGPATISGDDRQPHLSRDEAHALLLAALDAYRREHRTLPPASSCTRHPPSPAPRPTASRARPTTGSSTLSR